MRFIFIEIVLPLLILLFLRSALKGMFASFKQATAVQNRPTPQGPPSVPMGGELRKDPVCGTYVSTVGSPSKQVDGKPVYFCSTDCRDKFRAA